MALECTMTIARPLFAGSHTTVMLAIKNTGGSTTTISAIQPFVALGSPGRAEPPTITTGMSLQVLAAATNFYPFDIIAWAPELQNAPANAPARLVVGCTILSNDGTNPVASVQPMNVGIQFSTLYTQLQDPTSPGQFDFTQPANAALLLLA